MQDQAYRIGDVIGKWTIISERIRIVYRSAQPWGYRVRCACGTERTLTQSDLRSGHSLSCGCDRGKHISANRSIHGGTGTRLHGIWKAMRRRCNLVTDRTYARYGGRGIHVCPEWNAPTSFPAFRDWALSHGYTDELTIDRIDNAGDYSPENCRWATYERQANNQTTNRYLEAWGERKTLADWARDPRCLVPLATLSSRIHSGFSAIEALTTPRYQHVHRPRIYRTKRRLAEGSV